MLLIVLGTRPEIIKTAPVILEAKRRNMPVGILHTGQHYTKELDDIFFKELELPEPILNLNIGSHAAPKQIGFMIHKLADAFGQIRPSVVMVQGDTNTVLAGAIAGYKAGIPVAHLEAGLRSDDWEMPEEANRVLADRVSRWLFCPTEIQRERLKREAIDHEGVHVVGNTIVDASLHYAEVAKRKSSILERLHLTDTPFALLTMHRPSNVDDPERLRAMIKTIHEAATVHGLKTVFPVHPRTKHVMDAHGISLDASFIELEPIGYLDLMRLLDRSEVVLTDSGGIQEEACILRVPTVTLRANTERPETLEVGSNILHFEADGESLAQSIKIMREKVRDWKNPFGDGETSKHVLDILEDI